MQLNKTFPEESGWFGSEGTLRGEEGVRPATSRVKCSQFGAKCSQFDALHHPVPVKMDRPLCQAPETPPSHTPGCVPSLFLGNAGQGARLGAEKEKELNGENLLRAKVTARTPLWKC